MLRQLPLVFETLVVSTVGFAQVFAPNRSPTALLFDQYRR